MHGNLSLPDRQLVKVAKYLWDWLRSDEELLRAVDTADGVVSRVLGREPVDVKGGSLRIHSAGLPALAWYWEGGVVDPDASVNNFGDKRRFKLQYLIRVPGDSREADGLAVARSWVYNVWWSALRAFYSAQFYACASEAMIRRVTPGKYSLVPLWQAGLVLLDATVDVEHLSPPYDPGEIDALTKIIADLDLYNESGSVVYTTEFEVAI